MMCAPPVVDPVSLWVAYSTATVRVLVVLREMVVLPGVLLELLVRF